MITGYVGIPFLDFGRSRSGCDCWGLVRLVYEEVARILLPTYGEISAYDIVRVAREFRLATSNVSEIWRNVQAEPRRELDVVVMKSLDEPGTVPWHCGVMVDPMRVLHTEPHTGSVAPAISHPTVASRVIGIYRHRDLP